MIKEFFRRFFFRLFFWASLALVVLVFVSPGYFFTWPGPLQLVAFFATGLGLLLFYCFAAQADYYAHQLRLQAPAHFKYLLEDLAKAQNELEDRVYERTAELEEAKSNLERRVVERTTELERARRATIHLLKDLKEDMIKLQNVDRLKTEFLSMVSHELRTPLTPIKGYISLLASEKLGPLAAAQKQALQILNRQSDNLSDLVESLLDITRLELGKPIPIAREPASLKLLIDEVLESILLLADSRQLVLVVEAADNLPEIMVDRIKIKRVLINLLGNAVKFTPRGGRITIKTFVQDNYIFCEIADTGIGIPPELLEKVFQKFFQIENQYTAAAGGIGMGLAISRELIDLHGGKIRAESQGLDKGTKIIFNLPLAKGGNI